MFFKPPAGDPAASHPGRQEPRPQGIAGRVEAAARASAPAPRGKGVVMILLGLAVVVALVWDFTRGSAASRAVRESVGDGKRPVAREDPDTPAPDQPASPGGNLMLRVRTAEGQDLSLPPPAAAALLASAPAEGRGDLRRQILESLVEPAGAKGGPGRRALEIAAWFARDAEPECATTVAQLTLKAYPALEDDRTAPAAILFLDALSDRGGTLAAAALDGVILDRKRALHVRIAAARARPAEGRPETVKALATDQATHPALRAALGE